MFAFEGLGSIYWHMIAKLLLAAEECHRAALNGGAGREVIDGLREAYYDIRRGLGFTKTPEVYGAFPTDPYSHTPRHLGAQQPGMTGQVKEEILTRRAELGVRVDRGELVFEPTLLRRSEFSSASFAFSYLDLSGQSQTWELPVNSLAFTCCQVLVCYELADTFSITVGTRDGQSRRLAGQRLGAADSRAIFARRGEIVRLRVGIPAKILCCEPGGNIG
jgi:hypothetical protein